MGETLKIAAILVTDVVGFIHFHEPAVADHVRRHDCGQPPIGFMRFHPCRDPVRNTTLWIGSPCPFLSCHGGQEAANRSSRLCDTSSIFRS